MGQASRLVVALDSPQGLGHLARSLDGIAAGLKVGMPAIIANGAQAVKEVREAARESMVIVDLKLADIGDIMVKSVETIKSYIDAVIAHSFVGYLDALERLSEYLDKIGVKLVVVASMSHRGSYEFYDRSLDSIESLLSVVRPWGVVAPATKPWIIRRLREDLGPDVVIMSPGVGFQGARPGSAICAGANYEIVGRSITESRDPVAAALEVVKAQEEAERACKA